MNMNTKGLVSIITPCYNGEKYVHRLLDSILIQDYPLIEMFVIDDGSTDASWHIIQQLPCQRKSRQQEIF